MFWSCFENVVEEEDENAVNYGVNRLCAGGPVVFPAQLVAVTGLNWLAA